MKFSGKTEIEASLTTTFAAFADFDAFERDATRAGTRVARTDDLSSPGPGMMWDIQAEFRGKPRKIEAELVDYDPPNSLDFKAVTSGFDATVRVDLVPLSARQTRAQISFDIRPTSLAARLMLQSARLAKGRLARKFHQRLARFGRDLEKRIQSA